MSFFFKIQIGECYTHCKSQSWRQCHQGDWRLLTCMHVTTCEKLNVKKHVSKIRAENANRVFDFCDSVWWHLLTLKRLQKIFMPNCKCITHCTMNWAVLHVFKTFLGWILGCTSPYVVGFENITVLFWFNAHFSCRWHRVINLDIGSGITYIHWQHESVNHHGTLMDYCVKQIMQREWSDYSYRSLNITLMIQ